ncbi:hypothetical protein TNCV_4207551 [Trichonephila clavipes]|nr:hypothetical protein TNCV_4207551 [Trichonephila clavipes]
MSDSEMDLTPPTPALSYRSRSNNSSRSTTPKPTEPPTACERRRLAMARKRKNSKNNSDDFVFPSKTARPTTPTPVLEPIEVQNSFTNLDQDPEIVIDKTDEIPILKPRLPFS